MSYQRLIACPGIDPARCDSLIDGDRLVICSNCRRDRAAQPSADNAPAEDSANAGWLLLGARQPRTAGEAGGVSLASSAANFTHHERTQ